MFRKSFKGIQLMNSLAEVRLQMFLIVKKVVKNMPRKELIVEERFKRWALREIEYLEEIDCDFIIKMEEYTLCLKTFNI